MNKAVSIAILAGGILLIIFGVSASKSLRPYKVHEKVGERFNQ